MSTPVLGQLLVTDQEVSFLLSASTLTQQPCLPPRAHRHPCRGVGGASITIIPAVYAWRHEFSTVLVCPKTRSWNKMKIKSGWTSAPRDPWGDRRVNVNLRDDFFRMNRSQDLLLRSRCSTAHICPICVLVSRKNATIEKKVHWRWFLAAPQLCRYTIELSI